MALLVLFVVFALLELIETLLFIREEGFAEYSTLQLIYEGAEYLVLIGMALALLKEEAVFLIPFIVQMLIFAIFTLFLVAQTVFALFAPFSEIANDYIADKSLGLKERLVTFIIYFIIVSLFCVFSLWSLQVAFLSYLYFEDRKRKALTAQSHADAQQQFQEPNPDCSAPTPPPIANPTVTSFPNPNYNLSDDDEDSVFEAKRAPALS